MRNIAHCVRRAKVGWSLPLDPFRRGVPGMRAFSTRRSFQSEDLEISRHSVFGEASEDVSVFQATTATYRPVEPVWRQHNLDLLQKTRARDEAALRKKLKHHARARGWMEAAEFLVGFVEGHADGLSADELRDWERLMACDDMFLMRLVARSTNIPPELDTSVLRKLQKYFDSCGLTGMADKL
eukprot:TRINITY_DN80267_c0_g1_i1.p1 TRINITY_DN80267_c0_g1~~TRINITY_DN80267_c0_g1_i1.p1  ORF type:complete len:195 (+),score=32.03 TRINITY_DN80267_c0_g1_i1:37-585(+)